MTRSSLVILATAVALGAALFSAAYGTDEFGRNYLSTIASAIVLSTLRAFLMSFCLLLLSSFLAIIVELRPVKFISVLVQIAVDALESVPIYIWVLAGISWAPRHGATLAAAIFVVAGLPLAFNSLRGVVRQITQQTYFKAAIALGADNWQLARNHILPNMFPYLAPLSLHIIGAALAVYGGIGIFGFVNRQELDLGVFLLRGKEHAGEDNTVLLLAVLSFAAIFIGLRIAINVLQPNRRARLDI